MLPYTTEDKDSECQCWTPSSPSTGNDSVQNLPEIDVIEGSPAGQDDEVIHRAVTAAMAASDDIASIKENMEAELVCLRVPVRTRSAVLIATSALSKCCRRLTSAISNDDKWETVEPSLAADEVLVLPEFFNLDELFPVDEI
jgi:hypothetical protein